MNGFTSPNQSGQSGEQKFGAPPTPEVNIRTTESDIKSIERGESMPVPESVLPPETEKEPSFRPETQVPGDITGMEEEPPKGKKPWLWIILGIVIIGLGLLAYFVVFPLISSPPTSSPTPSPSPTTGIITPTPHNSLFLMPVPDEAEINLENFLFSTITNNLQLIAANRLPDNTIQEVAVLDAHESQVPWSSYLSTFLPTLTPTQLETWFEDDFTAFIFYDAKGAWPGYVAKIKNSANIDTAKATLTILETSDLSKFYLSPPGVFGQFKNGQINGKATRYAVGGIPGAALNYGFVNSYFIVSTSYDGLRAAAPLLGI